MDINWFSDLFGFNESELSFEDIQNQFLLEGSILTSKANNKSFDVGAFETSSLKSIRSEGRRYINLLKKAHPTFSVSSIFTHERFGVKDVFYLAAEYPGSVIQAASQFNCLEFIHPEVIPEHGVTRYASDYTQGPSCAVSCGAGTVYRNYFVPLADSRGQRADRQINNLDEFEALISNEMNKYIKVKNGYSYAASETSLHPLNTLIESNTSFKDELRDAIKVGAHWNVGVTFGQGPIRDNLTVTQVYSSAISVGYDKPGIPWAPTATLVLEANYEAILWIAIIQKIRILLGERETQGHEDKLFLTLLGGGVFRNHPDWINGAINRAIQVVEAEVSPLFPQSSGEGMPFLQIKQCFRL